MSELSRFGRIVRYYAGKGRLSAENGSREAVECSFEAAQFSNNDIRMILHRNDFFPIWGISAATINFEGVTRNGRTLRAIGPVFIQHSTDFTHNHYKVHLRFNSSAKLQIDELDASNEEVRFAITNFKFTGTEVVSIAADWETLGRLRLSINGLEITIDQLPDYDERLTALETSQSCDITCELAIPLKQCTIENAVGMADRICDLLSIARGRRINWIFYEVYNDRREPTFTEHRLRITAPYTGFELIDYRPPENTKHFVEECYPRSTQLHAQFDLNTIANIGSDIHSRGFVEARCLLIFSLLEHFFHKTSKETKNQEKRPSTKERIQLLVRKYSVPIEDDEIDQYVAFRNDLVHELKLPDDQQIDYKWLLHFYDRILLSLLGYTGHYMNATKWPLASGAQADKLTPKDHG